MVKAQVYPTDELDVLHTEENCFCYPVEMRDMVVHRSLAMIDQLGSEGTYITGYVAILPVTYV